MTSRTINDPLDDVQEQITRVRKNLTNLANRKQVVVPIWDADTIPDTFPDGVQGQFVIGENETAYVWKDGEWIPISGGGGGGGPVDAEDVNFTPYGDIISTDVQAAIQELDDDLVALDGDLSTLDTTLRALIDNMLPKPDGFSKIDVNTSGDHLIVTNPNAGNKIQIINGWLIANQGVVVYWCSDAGGASLSGEIALQQGTGWVAPLGYWEVTDTNEDLYLNTDAAIQVNGFVTWRYTLTGL